MRTVRLLTTILLSALIAVFLLALAYSQDLQSFNLRGVEDGGGHHVGWTDDITLTVKHVDISRYPEVSIIFDARNRQNEFVFGLKGRDLLFFKDGVRKDILSLEKISARNSVPVDFVFVLDQTGSMIREVEVVKSNIGNFIKGLATKGIDYQLGLVTFSDSVESKHELTDNLSTFTGWIQRLEVAGGGDEKENALEALRAATTLRFRRTASRIIILITDALYHQQGEHGDGTTTFATQTIIPFLIAYGVRVYCVAPSQFPEFESIARGTDAKAFDIYSDFCAILNDCGNEITNLYALRFLLPSEVPARSARVKIERASDSRVLCDEELNLIDIEKKFVVDDVLFDFDKAFIRPQYVPALDRIAKLLQVYPLSILISGHTDDVGSDAHNQALSEDRAGSVKDYLVKAGCNSRRVSVKGYGKTHPVASNDTEEGRRRNRRVEIVLEK